MKLTSFRLLAAAAIAGAAGCSSAHGEQTSATPQFTKAYELKADEGVFAYSRISPDGKALAYASEMRVGGRLSRTVTVVDLPGKKVLYTERGIDAYFSNDSKRMIYLGEGGGRSGVVIRHHDTGEIVRGVAPLELGDYFSWAVRDGKSLILTIQGNYYYLNGDHGVMPHGTVPDCPGIGGGDRPLISKDGRRITTFVSGNVIVRGLDNCNDVINTGIEGAKSDFSFDGRYIAMHAQKERGTGYDLFVVDLRDKTVRNVTSSLSGSSYFPSWTSDGRLSFRYDGADYRGFMFASNVLSAPTKPLPRPRQLSDVSRNWSDIFPETAQPGSKFTMVFVWGPWGAHSPEGLSDMQSAQEYFRERGIDATVLNATDHGSQEADVNRLLGASAPDLKRIPLAPERLRLTEMHNQNPTTLLFRDGKLIDRKMGAQTRDWLVSWVAEKGARQ